MSYLISGLNIKNISEYDSSIVYSPYEIVDYQLNTGFSVMPNYTGFGVTGLTTWFSNDSLNNFLTDTSFRVTGWLNNVSGSGNLFTLSSDVNDRGLIDFNESYITLSDSQVLSGSGFNSDSRVLFLAFEVLTPINIAEQTICKFGTGTNYGFLKVNGKDELFSAKFILDNQEFNAISSIYDDKNIITLIQDPSTTSIKIRQNGYELGTYSSFNDYWKSGELVLGANPNNIGIRYHEIIHFTGSLNTSQINQYEKYLFEKYFKNDGLYFAKNNVPQGVEYSPITYTGKSYWTRNINDLFFLSYGSSASFTAKLSPLVFGDGYKTNVTNGINTLNSKFNIIYDGLTDLQAKALITYFENTPQSHNKSDYEGFKGVDLNLFTPYKQNCETYFVNINHSTPYNDINKINIEAEAFYESCLNYKGMYVLLDEKNVRTYTDKTFEFAYNDVFYYPSTNYSERGYYFYTGEAKGVAQGSTGPLSPQNSPTGVNSYFTRDFYFKQDIEYDIQENIRIKTTDFKNSTREYVKDGEYPNLFEFEVKLSKRSNKEALAILKFLDDKAGFKIFNFTLPQPYNKTIQVYCPEWNHTYQFYDNNTITAKFVQFNNKFSGSTVFNSLISFIS
jgi:phage-related protein